LNFEYRPPECEPTAPWLVTSNAELEAEARTEGPVAVAELEALRLRFWLARQLAAQRRALHLTQLAEMTGIDQAEISRIERGQANPTATTLGTVTRALGLERAVGAGRIAERREPMFSHLAGAPQRSLRPGF
jgi:DNA-binding phage protein